MKKCFVFAIAVLLLAFNGCKKDEIEIEATKMKLIEKLDKLDVPTVMKNSSNTNAVTAVGYVDYVKGIANYFAWFDVPEDAQREGLKSTQGEVYFWNYGGVSVWETYSETASQIIWDIDIDSGNGRKKYIHAEEDKDGSNGTMEIYDYYGEINGVIFTYVWSFDSTGNGTLTCQDTAGTFKYEVRSNIDLSGYAKMFSSGYIIYYFMWNSDGSGSYSYYNTDGSVFLSETWSVADL